MSGLPDDDPGWGGLGGVLLGMVIPSLAIRRAGRHPSPLVATRQVFLSFSFALVMFLVVLLFMDLDVEDPMWSPTTAAVGVLVIGFALQLLSSAIAKELPCDEAQMLGMYRTTFFLRTAFAESAALLGFMAVFLVGSLLPYLTGLIPAAIGFARNAPTRANLRREDEALRNRGCPHSIYDLLLRSGPAPT